MNDAFSAFHPAVNLLFFAGAICCGMLFQHPAYIAVSILSALTYYLFLKKRRALKPILSMLFLFLLIAGLNPLFNTQGTHILFSVFGRPYTLEALLYGLALAGIMLTTLLWFGCFNLILTGDKLSALLSNLIPSLSLLLVMVLRMVPNLTKKGAQIHGARKAIGRGISKACSDREKLTCGMAVLGVMVSWALEGSLITADSMRARGYGTAKRQSFLIYRMKTQDWWLLIAQVIFLTAVIISACLGQATAVYTPKFSYSSLSWGAVIYGAYLLIPLALNIKEAIAWHISRLKI